MKFMLITFVCSIGLLFGMLLFTEIGRRIGVAAHRRHGGDDKFKGSTAAEAAVLGLLGLLLAFSFSGAASRFEDRRHLVNDETNAIGTAYLRLDLLAQEDRATLQEMFRQYVDARIAIFENYADDQATLDRLAAAGKIQSQIWDRAQRACQAPDRPTTACMLLLPALNEMIDITTTRVTASRNHPPKIVFFLLAGLSLMGALLVGFGSSPDKRDWFYTLLFSAMLTLTYYIILDLEYPRLGLITVKDADQTMVELRESLD